jgi:hypothetical protein
MILPFPCRRRRRRLQWRRRRGTAVRRRMRAAVTSSVLMTLETTTYLRFLQKKAALELNTWTFLCSTCLPVSCEFKP